jgi:hypothetical protein
MIPPLSLIVKAARDVFFTLVMSAIGAAFLAFMLDVFIGPFRRGDPALAIYGCWFVGGAFAGCLGYFGGSTALSPLGDAWAYRPGAKIVGRWMLAVLVPTYLVLMPFFAALAGESEGPYAITFFVTAILAAGLMHWSIERNKANDAWPGEATAAETKPVYAKRAAPKRKG